MIIKYYELTKNGKAIASAKYSGQCYEIACGIERAADIAWDGFEGSWTEYGYGVVEKEREGVQAPEIAGPKKPKVSWCEVDDSVYYDMFG